MRPTTHKSKALAAKPAAALLGSFASLVSFFPGVSAASDKDPVKTASSVLEASLVEDIGAAERIEAADMLRTLSQEVAASACFYFGSVSPAETREQMLKTRTLFRLNYDAILNGNPAMNIIGGETRRRTLEDLAAIDDLWEPVDAAVGLLAENPTDLAAVNIIKDNSVPLFELTNHLVSEMSGEYSNPAELLQSDVLTLEISGRQSMLSQKIAKNACKVWSRDEAVVARETLINDMQTFETALNALRHGMPQLGLKPAPTQAIADGLDTVLRDWSETRKHLDDLIAGGTLPEPVRAELFERMNTKTVTLEEVTHLYVIFAKHSYE